jgi:hypothetical protein
MPSSCRWRSSGSPEDGSLTALPLPRCAASPRDRTTPRDRPLGAAGEGHGARGALRGARGGALDVVRSSSCARRPPSKGRATASRDGSPTRNQRSKGPSRARWAPRCRSAGRSRRSAGPSRRSLVRSRRSVGPSRRSLVRSRRSLVRSRRSLVRSRRSLVRSRRSLSPGGRLGPAAPTRVGAPGEVARAQVAHLVHSELTETDAAALSRRDPAWVLPGTRRARGPRRQLLVGPGR